jgi:anti-sigma factor RsiW
MGDRPIGDDDLQAYVDDRLTPDLRESVEAYLRANPDVAARVQSDRALRDDLRERLAFKAQEPIPARLRVASIIGERRETTHRRLRAVAAALTWLVIGGGAGWTAHAWLSAPQSVSVSAHTAAVDAMVAHRLFAPEVVHPVEVPASQEAHLVQWLSKRLGYAVKAPDLGPQGLRLLGGRLLPDAGSPAAQFMYEDENGRRYTLYCVRETGRSETAFRFAAAGDAAAFYWIDGQMGYALVGPNDRERLLGLARAVYEALEGAPQPSNSGPRAL